MAARLTRDKGVVWFDQARVKDGLDAEWAVVHRAAAWPAGCSVLVVADPRPETARRVQRRLGRRPRR